MGRMRSGAGASQPKKGEEGDPESKTLRDPVGRGRGGKTERAKKKNKPTLALGKPLPPSGTHFTHLGNWNLGRSTFLKYVPEEPFISESPGRPFKKV